MREGSSRFNIAYRKMTESKQIVSALALFGLYALVASIVPHFKSQTAVFVAMFEYNALSVLVWSCLVGLVKWMLRGSMRFCVIMSPKM